MATSNPVHGPKEVRLLALLKDVQVVLADALNNLCGQRPPPEAEAAYLGKVAARTINRAADGYLLLRQAYRVDASKLLIRPAIEAVFAAAAVMTKRGFLFRKAYTEWMKETKLFAKDSAFIKQANEDFENFQKALLKRDPSYPIERKIVDVRYAAQLADLLPHYEVSYLTYCQFTHGTVRAVLGYLDEATESHDTEMMIACVLTILELLKKHTPASIPDLAPFHKKLENCQ